MRNMFRNTAGKIHEGNSFIFKKGRCILILKQWSTIYRSGFCFSFWVFHDHHRLSSSLQTLQYVPASKSGSQTRVANFDHRITFNSTRHVTRESKSPMFCHRIVIYLLSFLYNFVHIHQVTCSQHTFPQIMAQVQFSMNVRVRLGFLLSQSRGHRWKESSVLFCFEQSQIDQNTWMGKEGAPSDCSPGFAGSQVETCCSKDSCNHNSWLVSQRSVWETVNMY